jgi:hypothetical protein
MGLLRKMTSVSTLGLVPFRSGTERIARNTKRGYKATRLQTRVLAAGMSAQIAQGNAQLAQGNAQSTMLAAQVAYTRALFLQTPAGQAQLAEARGQVAACENAWRQANDMVAQAQVYLDALKASRTARREQLRQARANVAGWISERDRIAGHLHAVRQYLVAVAGY